MSTSRDAGAVPQGRQGGADATDNTNGFMLGGRGYFNWQSLLPSDEDERDRMDIFHKFFSEARRVQHSAAITPYNGETRVLDIGAGTGIWALTLASLNPHMRVLGIDQARIQPQGGPRQPGSSSDRQYANCHFSHFDLEGPWLISEPQSWHSRRSTFDFVHIRMMLGCIANWPELYGKIYQNLRPGGTVEQVEFDWELRARDNTMPENSALQRWNSMLQTAMARAGRPVSVGDVGTRLQAAGFVNIQHHSIDAGCNPWSSDPAESNVARWLNLALVCSVEGMCLLPFTRYLGLSVEEALETVKDFQREVCTLRIHSYGTLHVWTATRP